MRILLTGASSFTGFWFARALASAGHAITATLYQEAQSYNGIRANRVKELSKIAEVIEECPFGSDVFLSLINKSSWDKLCHHAAQVGDYKNPDFDVAAALALNTKKLPTILKTMKSKGLKGVVLTGSVFEANEGRGSMPLRAFSPYGLSKGLTSEMFRFYCSEVGIPLAKFVIPNPFGPYEEPRFCNYLLQCWKNKKAAAIKTPDYVRDNIPVSLLALCYVQTVSNTSRAAFQPFNPSGYVETQGAFAMRFAHEIGTRLKIDCPIELAHQTEFSEPIVRINTDIPNHSELGWNEVQAWDELAAYYRQTM